MYVYNLSEKITVYDNMYRILQFCENRKVRIHIHICLCIKKLLILVLCRTKVIGTRGKERSFFDNLIFNVFYNFLAIKILSSKKIKFLKIYYKF